MGPPRDRMGPCPAVNAVLLRGPTAFGGPSRRLRRVPRWAAPGSELRSTAGAPADARSAPSNAVALTVRGGLLNTMLGDASHANMTPIPASTFSHPDAHIRMWFGGSGGESFEKLSPDRPLGSVPYALVAERVPDNSIDGEKLRRESVWPEHEGRNDCIVTYYAEYTRNLTGLSTNMPAERNFIITDIIYGVKHYDGTGINRANVEIRYELGGKDTVLFSQWAQSARGTDGDAGPEIVTLKGGLVVPAGALLRIGGFVDHSSFNYSQSCTISGFEIPVE